ncbi:MAG: PAS domain S-box protein [Actinomycetota bacterium]|nr:PAS domain S-box protein [Actinomycetota bacterium]
MSDWGSRFFDELLQASPDALLVVDEKGIIRLATKAVTELFGYEPDDLVGRSVDLLVPIGVQDRHRAHRDDYRRAPGTRPMGEGLDLRAVRSDGTELSVDVSLVPMEREGGFVVGAFVRDATSRRRDEDLLRFVNEMSRLTIEGWGTEELLEIVARRARVLIGATVAWVAVTAPSGDAIVVAAADGPGAADLIGAEVPSTTSLAAAAMRSGRPRRIANMTEDALVLPEAKGLGLESGVYLPMVAEDGPVGALVLARSTQDRPFEAAETTAAEVFASAAAIVLALGSARRTLEEARLVGEQERIARDLHDTVIQRLFALGMRLQATERVAEGPVAERIRDTVESIDAVIREIRETIFDLNQTDPDGRGLRQTVREVTAEAHAHLGFAPRVAFRGPVESAIPDEIAGHLLSVLREALANVGRHAQASRVDVVVSVADGTVSLTVADDGVGMANSPTAGNGVSNMRSRAESLGGRLQLTPRRPSGTLLSWAVPRTPRSASLDPVE